MAQIESGDNETTTAHREVARALDGRREQRAVQSPPLVDSRLLRRDRGGKGLSCCALDPANSEDEVAHKMHAHQCDFRRVANPSARDPFPPPRGHRPALDSVSLTFDTIRA